MTQAEFVEALRDVVLRRLGADISSTWSNPPGRFRSAERSARANWINGLSPQDREQVERLADDAAQAALFGFLCVLDGSRAIENGDRGKLQLRYLHRNTTTLLASSEGEVLPLHEIL